MKIFIIGQTTLHWGRMEFGNIGNYYIIEPFIREIHTVFPGAQINTTLQMSTEFCKNEKINVVPMELYYGFNENDLPTSLIEMSSAQIFNKTGYLPYSTPFIDKVLESDLIIDFSGDIWGDNANLLGNNRFLIGLLKIRTAQLLQKKTAMLAGSPGPFSNQEIRTFAREVYSHFNLVTHRESISERILTENGFYNRNTKNLSCPAFLFEPKETKKVVDIEAKLELNSRGGIGFILCGWNFLEGPFDKWPRPDSDYSIFVESIRYITQEIKQRVFLLSHSNGFPIPPKKFELQHGRDYKTIRQLYEILKNEGLYENCILIDDVLTTWETKSLISNFDMLISGRVHGAVAGLSQYVPTVIIDYGHEPKAHKLKGFAIEAGVEEYVADPSIEEELIIKIKKCWSNKDQIKSNLKVRIPQVKEKAKLNFQLLKELF